MYGQIYMPSLSNLYISEILALILSILVFLAKWAGPPVWKEKQSNVTETFLFWRRELIVSVVGWQQWKIRYTVYWNQNAPNLILQSCQLRQYYQGRYHSKPHFHRRLSSKTNFYIWGFLLKRMWNIWSVLKTYNPPHILITEKFSNFETLSTSTHLISKLGKLLRTTLNSIILGFIRSCS